MKLMLQQIKNNNNNKGNIFRTGEAGEERDGRLPFSLFSFVQLRSSPLLCSSFIDSETELAFMTEPSPELTRH